MLPTHSEFIVSHDRLLRHLALQNGDCVTDARHDAFLLLTEGARHGKGVGWVVNALRKSSFRRKFCSALVSVGNSSAEQESNHANTLIPSPECALLIAEELGLRQQQLKFLGNDVLLVLAAFSEGTDGLAERLTVSRRRAQQLAKKIIGEVENATSTDEMLNSLGRLAARLRKTDAKKRLPLRGAQ